MQGKATGLKENNVYELERVESVARKLWLYLIQSSSL